MQSLARISPEPSRPAAAARLLDLANAIARDLALYDEADPDQCTEALALVRRLRPHDSVGEVRRAFSEMLRRALVAGYAVSVVR
jgi:hypothetical protein